MKNPLGIFVLTKREQRMVIVIVMVLLAVTIAKRYRETPWHIAPPTSTSISATAAPSPAPAKADSMTSDGSPHPP